MDNNTNNDIDFCVVDLFKIDKDGNIEIRGNFKLIDKES